MHESGSSRALSSQPADLRRSRSSRCSGRPGHVGLTRRPVGRSFADLSASCTKASSPCSRAYPSTISRTSVRVSLGPAEGRLLRGRRQARCRHQRRPIPDRGLYGVFLSGERGRRARWRARRRWSSSRFGGLPAWPVELAHRTDHPRSRHRRRRRVALDIHSESDSASRPLNSDGRSVLMAHASRALPPSAAVSLVRHHVSTRAPPRSPPLLDDQARPRCFPHYRRS